MLPLLPEEGGGDEVRLRSGPRPGHAAARTMHSPACALPRGHRARPARGSHARELPAQLAAGGRHEA